jgi:phosphate transport system substrate-binding protein
MTGVRPRFKRAAAVSHGVSRHWGLTPVFLFVTLVAFAEEKGTTGLEMQKARAENLVTKGKKAYYPADKWDLSDLPAYTPKERVKGTLRISGSNYVTDGNLGDYWEQAFRKFHPDAKVEYNMLTTRTAAPSLVFGAADLGISRKLKLDELQLYQRWANRDPLEIVIATGSYNVTGWNPAFGIVVHKDNPLTKITFEQLDGIFGAERLGGWSGTDWHPEVARGPEKNLRKWGQLGLGGEWADKEIVPYGLNLRYTQASTFSDRVLGGSDKWNEKLRIYANYASAEPGGEGSNMGFGRLKRGLNEDLVKDRYGIAYVGSPVGPNLPPQLKLLEVAEAPNGPYYAYTIDNLRSRRYPLYDEMFAYAVVDANGRTDAKVREFLRFVLSREGQNEVMRDGKYLPLTAEVVRAELKKLDK